MADGSPPRLTSFALHSDDAKQSNGLLARFFRMRQTAAQAANNEALQAVIENEQLNDFGTDNEPTNTGEDKVSDTATYNDTISVTSDTTINEEISSIPQARTLTSVLRHLSRIVAGRSQTPQAYKDSDFKQYWMPDSNCHQCYECNVRFTTFRRRHHCRICGQIFCSYCCNQVVPGRIMGYTGELRVCKYCCEVALHYAQNPEVSPADINSRSPSMTPDLRRGGSIPRDLGDAGGSTRSRLEGPGGHRALISSSRAGSISGTPWRSNKVDQVSYIFDEDLQQESDGASDFCTPDSILNRYQDDHSSLIQDSERLRELWLSLRNKSSGVEIQSQKYRGRLYTNCMLGSDIVDWLISNNKAKSRKQAVSIGQALLTCCYMEGLHGNPTGMGYRFRDDFALYYPTEMALQTEAASATVDSMRREESTIDSDEEGEPIWVREIRREVVKNESGNDNTKIPSTVSAPDGGFDANASFRSVFYVDSPLGTEGFSQSGPSGGSVNYQHPAQIAKDRCSRESVESSHGGMMSGGGGMLSVESGGGLDVMSSVDQGAMCSSAHEISGGRACQVSLSSSNEAGSASPERESIENEYREQLSKLHKDHIGKLLNQLLVREKLSQSWADVILPIVQRVSQTVRPDVRYEGDDMDIRQYVRIKKIPGGSRSNTAVVNGVVCSKAVAHKKMRQQISNPRVLLLRSPIEYQRIENKFSSLEPQILQEHEFLKNCVARIASLQPDILMVEKTVSRLAQGFLLDAGITLILNVKASVMQRVARLTMADVVTSIDSLVGRTNLGHCQNFSIRAFNLPDGFSKSLMYFEGCPAHLGCTVTLRGASVVELKMVKKIISFMTYTMYHSILELSFLSDELACISLSDDNQSEDASEVMEDSIANDSGFPPLMPPETVKSPKSTKPIKSPSYKSMTDEHKPLKSAIDPSAQVTGGMKLLVENTKESGHCMGNDAIGEKGGLEMMPKDGAAPDLDTSIKSIFDDDISPTVIASIVDDDSSTAATLSDDEDSTAATAAEFDLITTAPPAVSIVDNSETTATSISAAAATATFAAPAAVVAAAAAAAIIGNITAATGINAATAATVVAAATVATATTAAGLIATAAATVSPAAAIISAVTIPAAALSSESSNKLKSINNDDPVYRLTMLKGGTSDFTVTDPLTACIPIESSSEQKQEKSVVEKQKQDEKMDEQASVQLTKFSAALKDVCLSVSPLIRFQPPHLEPKFGKSSVLKSYIHQDAYWSQRFDVVSPGDQEDNNIGDGKLNENSDEKLSKNINNEKLPSNCEEKLSDSDNGIDVKERMVKMSDGGLMKESRKLTSFPGAPPGTEMLSPHPFVIERIKAPACDPNIQALLADFRARGGRIPYHLSLNGQTAELVNPSKVRKLSMQRPAGYATSSVATVDPATGLVDCLDPLNHQRIALLFSSFSPQSSNAPAPCVFPWTVNMRFYARASDVTLGGFLEKYCFSETYRCVHRNCDSAMLDHVRRFVHGSACIQVNLKKLDTPMSSGGGGISMWTWCRQCRQVGSVVPMSSETYSMSFGKYLELRFHADRYNRQLCREDNGCRHSLHKDHFHYFAQNQTVASFKYAPIRLKEVCLAPITVKILPQNIPQDSLLAEGNVLESRTSHIYCDILTQLLRLKAEASTDQILSYVTDLIAQLERESESVLQKVEYVQSLVRNISRLTDPSAINSTSLQSLDAYVEIKHQLAEAVLIWNERIHELDAVPKRPERGARSANASQASLTGLSNTPSSAQLEINDQTTGGSPVKESSIADSQINESHFALTKESGVAGVTVASDSTIVSAKDPSSTVASAKDSGSAIVLMKDPSSTIEPARNSSCTITPIKETSMANIPAIDSSTIGIFVNSPNNVAQSQTCRDIDARIQGAQQIDPLTSSTKDGVIVKNVESSTDLAGDSDSLTSESPVTFQINCDTSVTGSEINQSVSNASLEESVSSSLSIQPRSAPLRSPSESVLESQSCGATETSTGRSRSPAPDSKRISWQNVGPTVGNGTPIDGEKKERAEKPVTVKQMFSNLLSSAVSSTVTFPYPAEEHHQLDHSGALVPVIVSDQEPSSIIAYALSSHNYKMQLKELRSQVALASDTLGCKKSPKPSVGAAEQETEDNVDGLKEVAEKLVGGNGGGVASLKAPPSPAAGHIEMQFSDSTTKFYCRASFAAQFAQLRQLIFPDGEERYIRSLSRCFTWLARGGKSGSSFCKTQDDRFILKQMSKNEVQSFNEFAPNYFEYITRAHAEKSPVLLAKILGVYKIGYQNSKTAAALKQDLLVMENLFYERKISQIYDLKGSARNREVAMSSKHMKDIVLLDQNFLKASVDSPLYVHPYSKSLLMKTISRDTDFLARHLVMDYSLLVGVDESNDELVLGIIDYIRTFTWDKKVEMLVKATYTGHMPTVVSPDVYRKRYLDAMDRYFLTVPDQWHGLGKELIFGTL